MIWHAVSSRPAVQLGVLLVLLLSWLPLHAQDDCKARALQVMERIRMDLDNAEQNRLYSKVVVTTLPSDASEPASKETLELISGDERTAYVTPQLLMLEDRDARVVVMPMDKLVYIYDHMPIEKGPNETWWKFTELAFTVGKLLTCKESVGTKGNEVLVEFDVAAINEMNGVHRIRYRLDATHAKPIAYRSLFGPSHTLRERTFDFLAFEPGKADARVTTSVLAQVIPNGKLTTALRSYELKDMRTPKSRTLRSTTTPE